jgi:predicted small lipoprotein YifL
MKMRKNITYVFIFIILALTIAGCQDDKAPVEIPPRESLIPADAVKMTPEKDTLPPKLLSDEYQHPVPMPYPVNTRGAEDSAFIMPDGETLYVWFTPNFRMDVIEQAQDLVTGIYKYEKQGEGWNGPERIWLVEPGKPHLDGCGFFQEDIAWICGVREEIEGIHWFTSQHRDGAWSMAELSDFDPAYEVGELHISNDGTELYFHSNRAGGKGGMDIWISTKVAGEWGTPENLAIVNSEYDEGWPALNPQEDELWITKNYGLWRSKKVDGVWQVPEEIISTLAGEATIDQAGNVYFTHHYYENDIMIEADIYVAYKK